MANDQSGKDYEVGYGKPPKSGQFKPGHSGHKKKGKRPLTLQEIYAKEAARMITVGMDGKAQTLPQLAVVVRSLFNKAMKGDVNAIKCVLMGVAGLPAPADDHVHITDADLELLQEVLAKQLAKKGSDPDSGGSNAAG